MINFDSRGKKKGKKTGKKVKGAKVARNLEDEDEEEDEDDESLEIRAVKKLAPTIHVY